MDFMNVPKTKAQLFRNKTALTGEQPDAGQVIATAKEGQYLRTQPVRDTAGAPIIGGDSLIDGIGRS